MKRFCTIWALLCLLSTTYLYANSGTTCDDAIEVGAHYKATATAGQDIWYTAWTYDLPLTVYFTPNGESTQAPTITADFTCTKGHYDNEILQNLLAPSSGNAIIVTPIKLKAREEEVGGKKTYVLSMSEQYRNMLSSQAGITENLQVFVHVTFPEDGAVQITEDELFAQCIESANWVNLQEEFPVIAGEDETTYSLPISKWRTDSVRIIWKGESSLKMHLGTNDCHFTHTSESPDFWKTYSFQAGTDTVKLSNAEIKSMLKDNLQSSGIYYMHLETTSNGTMLFEHIPAPPAKGNATNLIIDETVSADSSLLYCFSNNWTESMFFSTAAVNRFRMVVATAPFDADAATTDSHIIGTYAFSKTESGHSLGLTEKQMSAIVKQSTDKYIYVRFYCIDPRAKVTPHLWNSSDCEEKAQPVPEGENINATTDIYRFKASEWCQGDINVKWTGSSSLYIYFSDTCDITVLNSANKRIFTTKTCTKSQALTLHPSDMTDWISKADADGFIYLRLRSQGSGKATITSTRPEEEEVDIPTYEPDSTFITLVNAEDTHLFTGLAEGYTIAGDFTGSEHRAINLKNCFTTDSLPLFDMLILFGETRSENGTVITEPTTKEGSNAVTTAFLYQQEENGYQLQQVLANINRRSLITSAISMVSAALEKKSVYISGFAPYASTGFTKDAEGILHLRGGKGDQIDIYLEDAYLYARNKTENGCEISTNNGMSFSEDYTRGSGAALVFECMDNRNTTLPFTATIHTRGTNLLRSTTGCYYSSAAGLVPQHSAAIQVHLNIADAYKNTPSYTVLNLTDEWPVKEGQTERTHGRLNLRKKAHNAPSIDLGNAFTIFNHQGGQLELQNAQIATKNYKNTLAICYRNGKVGGIDLAYGIGEDATGGTVNFYDGNTYALPMEVAEEYRQYYLMEADGKTTQCLRLPANTHIYGGSHCAIRRCESVEVTGGAPLGYSDQALGQVYTTLDGFDPNAECIGGTYGTESMIADKAGKYHLWLSANCSPNIHPEESRDTRFWMAAMTKISAEYGSFGGTIGGDIEIGNQQVSNLLYCVLDDNISAIISEQDNEDNYVYQAPVKNPAGSDYLRIAPSYVGQELSNNVTDEEDYTVQNRIYYICPATADVWTLFAAPFDVQNIYVMETYDEKTLSNMTENTEEYLSQREVVLSEQARHNADFAGFFGVVMALGSNTPFDDIYNDYITWAKQQDRAAGLWDGKSTYTLRGRKKMIANIKTSDPDSRSFYLYENSGDWAMSEDGSRVAPLWNDVTAGTTGLKKGHIYKMLLPYNYNTNKMEDSADEEREYYDYWSGKLLIFEGVGPQTIAGRKSQRQALHALKVMDNSAQITGNFALSAISDVSPIEEGSQVYTYSPYLVNERFYIADEDSPVSEEKTIAPTEAFLATRIPTTDERGLALSIKLTDGKIEYWKEEEEPTGIGNINEDENENENENRNGNNPHKRLYRGLITVERNGELYTLTGQKVQE